MPGVVLKSVKINEEGARSIYLSCQDGHDCTCIGTPRWKENKNVPNVIFKSVQI